MNPTELTIRKAAGLMTHGAFSSAELTKVCLHRIERLNDCGVKLRAVLEVNDDAIETAERLDQERAEGSVRGPLHGIPILLKDNLATGDRMHTSAGALALKDSFATRDAFIVKRLRKAGAVIIGKANMTEWANFISYTMPDGYSARGGRVKNYLDPDKFQVGGSSSGCAVGVAAGFALAAVGTETSGSIIKPSINSALVGFKPSLGLVSRSGIIPISKSQDTAGPMAKTVEDAAILLGAMAGADAEDVETLQWMGKRVNYLEGLTNQPKAELKIAVLEDFFTQVSSSHREMIERTLALMEQGGHQLIRIERFSPYENIYHQNAPDYLGEEVLLYEFKEALEEYLRGWTDDNCPRTLHQIMQYNEAHREEAIPYGQEVFYRAAEAGNGREIYLKAKERDYRVCVKNGLERVFDGSQADLAVLPHYFGCTLAARAGYPSMTLPVGVDPDLGPTGLTLIGKKYEDCRLLQMAKVIETILK